MIGNWEGLKTVFKFIDKNGSATISISDMKVSLRKDLELAKSNSVIYAVRVTSNNAFCVFCLGSPKYHEVPNVRGRETRVVPAI